MSKFILSVIALIASLNIATAHSNNNITANTPETKALKGSKLFLVSQTFVSSDSKSTDTDVVSNPGDYIEFGENGVAYMFYKGTLDSLRYYFTENNEVSFGDTPFEIKIEGNGIVTLHQKETEKNGDYNSTTYLLKKAAENVSFNK